MTDRREHRRVHHPFVIGSDTHTRSHSISILAWPTGDLVDEA